MAIAKTTVANLSPVSLPTIGGHSRPHAERAQAPAPHLAARSGTGRSLPAAPAAGARRNRSATPPPALTLGAPLARVQVLRFWSRREGMWWPKVRRHTTGCDWDERH